MNLSPGQLDILCRFGCDVIQGFFYSKPLAAEDFEAMLKQPAA